MHILSVETELEHCQGQIAMQSQSSTQSAYCVQPKTGNKEEFCASINPFLNREQSLLTAKINLLNGGVLEKTVLRQR